MEKSEIEPNHIQSFIAHGKDEFMVAYSSDYSETPEYDLFTAQELKEVFKKGGSIPSFNSFWDNITPHLDRADAIDHYDKIIGRFGVGFMGGADMTIWDRTQNENRDYKTVGTITNGIPTIHKAYTEDEKAISFMNKMAKQSRKTNDITVDEQNIETDTIYEYVMKNRPFGVGTFPDNGNFTGVTGTDVEINGKKYYNTIGYNSPLSSEEIYRFELADIDSLKGDKIALHEIEKMTKVYAEHGDKGEDLFMTERYFKDLKMDEDTFLNVLAKNGHEDPIDYFDELRKEIEDKSINNKEERRFVHVVTRESASDLSESILDGNITFKDGTSPFDNKESFTLRDYRKTLNEGVEIPNENIDIVHGGKARMSLARCEVKEVKEIEAQKMTEENTKGQTVKKSVKVHLQK